MYKIEKCFWFYKERSSLLEDCRSCHLEIFMFYRFTSVGKGTKDKFSKQYVFQCDANAELVQYHY